MLTKQKGYDIIMANNRMPFALCEVNGITIQKGWTPHDAWEALKKNGIVTSTPDDRKTVVSPQQMIIEHEKRFSNRLTKRSTLYLPYEEYDQVREAVSIKTTSAKIKTTIETVYTRDNLYIVEIYEFDKFRVIGKKALK